MACVGVSIAAGSASGLWLVSPLVALGCTALVLGYERHDLRERFGPVSIGLFPPAGEESPARAERLGAYLFVFLPWFVLYEGMLAIGAPLDAIVVRLPFEPRLPHLEWSAVICAGAYIVIGLAPLFARTQNDLRNFSVGGLWAMVLAFPLTLLFPLTGPPQAFPPQTALGRWLTWNGMWDGRSAAFPSFLVIWAWLAAELFARRWPRMAWLCYAWAILVSASSLTSAGNTLLGVLAGLVVVAIVMRRGAIWNAIRARAEGLANSWKEWRVGPVRIMNHGVYVGVGASIGLWMACSAAGAQQRTAVLVAAIASVVGAALWAQFVEGSSQLLRPFGFFGGLLGGSLGAMAAPLLHASPWLILAAFSTAGPFAQSFGRLRCLVQGCCHGRPAPESVGIRYVHPRSRVYRMTAWAGVPLHATPVYSILWNFVVALVVMRLWVLHAPLHLVAGLYFILTGLGRFVEEAWRGEPQTPVFARLRLYQWAAVASIVTGVLMTSLGTSGPAPNPHLAWSALLPSLAFGLFVCFAMSVDFPNSAVRFSRLL